MKAHINRIVSLLLVAVLTVPICTNTLKTAERFEVVQTLKAQGNYYPDDFTEQRFAARSAEVQKMIGDAGMAADANFTQKVTKPQRTALSQWRRPSFGILWIITTPSVWKSRK